MKMKLRWTFTILLLFSVINCFGIHGINAQVTVIAQPDNTTVCEGGIAVFTCVMDIQNVKIGIEDISWWRKRDDNNMTSMLSSPVTRYNITNVISEHRLTSVLMITDVRSADLGPYWLVLTAKKKSLCNNAFLSIVPNAPMNIGFTIENITDVSFVVQWDGVTNQAVDTYIVNWTNGTNPIQTVTVNETLYNVTGLTPNTTYTVTVAALNESCTGPLSNNESVTTHTITTDTDTTTTTTTDATTTDIGATTESITTSSIIMPTQKITNPPNATSDSGGSSGGAIAGGVIGAILAIVIIVIIIIVIYYFVFYRNKDNDDGKSPYYSVIRRSQNAKNTLAVSNSVTYDEVHKTEVKIVPHQTTDTGELYAISTKAINEDRHNEPPLLYTYARVDLDTKRKITETSVPHQTAADGVQYAVSTKAFAKDDYVTDNDVNEKTEDKEIKYADLQPLPTPPDIRNVSNEGSPQYTQLAT